MKEKTFKKGIKKRLFSVFLALAIVLSVMPMNKLTVYAAKHTITFDFDGGVDGEGNESKTFQTGSNGILSSNSLETISYLAISKDGYEHDGWLDQYSNPIELENHVFTGDVTLYANWVETSSCECSSVTKQDGQAETCTADGWKDYFNCDTRMYWITIEIRC